MKIKKFLFMYTLFFIMITLGLAFVISFFNVNSYFGTYLNDQYENNKLQIVNYVAQNAENFDASRLEAYIEEPIYGLRIDFENNINEEIYVGAIADFEDDDQGSIQDELGESFPNATIESIPIVDGNNKPLASIQIVKEKRISDTYTYVVFRQMLMNSLIETLLVVFIMFTCTYFVVSKPINNNVKAIIDYASGKSNTTRKYSIDELRDLQKAIVEYRMALGQKEKCRVEAVHKLLHETRTPLTIIKGFLEEVNDGVVSKDSLDEEIMLETVDQLADTINNIPFIFNSDEKEEGSYLEIVDYSEHLKRIIKNLSAKFNRKNIKISYIPKTFIINTNTVMLNRVIYNLLVNAYKYSEEGTEVTIETFKDRVVISDEGFGIPEDELQNIFSPYYRCRNIQKINGEGLGLSIVKENLEKLSATIGVTSRQNIGSKFTIYFDV